MNDNNQTKIIPEAIENVQMNIWNTGWANPQDMFDLGFDLINTIDGSSYMVPNGNGNRGGYGDYLNLGYLFSSFDVNRMGNANLPSGDDQVLGAAFAILLVKMLFGGLGRNIVNPALAGRAFMFSWPVLMSTWVKVGFENAAGLVSTADIVTAATPLASMHQGVIDPAAGTLMDLFLGNVGGCIGETSAALLLVGLVYLLIRKVLTIRIPVAFLGTVALIALLFPQGNDPLVWCGAQLCSGGVMLGAIFMATDYATSPVTARGQLWYGVGCGVLTVLFRYHGLYPEGVTYAILIMNAFVWFIDRYTAPRQFGTKKGGAAQ